ncbi:hypothetical protein R3W88_026869 [Solanum pinnatisectum]|uniref:Retrotransposon gag domain-containing protein n=1 Tax=Solanum pinnatisectum TaxID=50273 RepID=A0AAV9LEF0_9SOLN|nr:hypothetical protein R3W88_026869 [Solanum pinnatisectum]
MFPHVHLPVGFKTPKFEKYNGHGDPVAHLKRYCNQLRGAGSKEELFMAYFGEILMGIAIEWFIDQDTYNCHTWDDLARCFVQQFKYNIDIVPDRTSLANIRKKTTESFREYAIRWREKVARVKPLMKESEMIDVFLQAQERDYFHYLLSVVVKTFAEVIKIGEMVENVIKSKNIVSQATLRPTTQVINNGSGNLGGKKMKEDVATIVQGTQRNLGGHFINMPHLNFIIITICKAHNTLWSHINMLSILHIIIHIQLTILNGEHLHIRMLAPLLQKF